MSFTVCMRLSMISGSCRNADEICALVGYNAALSGNALVKDYHSMLCYTPEERRLMYEAMPLEPVGA
jgi:hypothetical protein